MTAIRLRPGAYSLILPGAAATKTKAQGRMPMADQAAEARPGGYASTRLYIVSRSSGVRPARSTRKRSCDVVRVSGVSDPAMW
ncbi:hypothetical protein LuPra_00779 [Luteitalea pratensis]|uniref:Uncharacterized protein n=1 Tax=Luteitalea pratensis TaxID=1855912 RepID=A0A143PGE9_LUTPR|nr:hypothetical protein LuPra_00779 [Luteitalea pratensis]